MSRQGCHGQEKYLNFFPGQGKVREFREDLESQGKVREFENKWVCRQSSENLFILFKWGRDVRSHEII